ncbi:MAG TPA: TonB-dependent receptor [Gemmatimonadales bacterium]
MTAEFAAAALLLPAALAAQATGTIVGTVRDTGGRPVARAQVRASGIPGPALSAADGRYRVSGVPAGSARVVVRALGFAAESASVDVPPDDSVSRDFALRPVAIEVGPIVVTAGKRPQSLADVVASVDVVGDSEIARRAVNTVDEAVDKAPGVQVLNGQINIRGSTGYVQGLGSRVLFLIDGVPANEGDRGGINWDVVPLDDIERVEIVKGAGSALYGSAALGGVVNVITRPIPDGWHARARLTAGAYADPPDTAWDFRSRVGMLGGGDLTGSYGSDRFRGSVTAGGRHSDGYRQQDAEDHWQLAGKGGWRTDAGTQVNVSGAWASDQFQEPLLWCVRGRCDDHGLTFQPFKVDTGVLGNHTRSDKGYLTGVVTRTPSDRLTWMMRGSWFRTHFTDFQKGPDDAAIANRFGAEGRLVARPTEDQTVTVGVELTQSDVSSNIFSNHTQGEFAAYGESERRIGAAKITAGARADFLTVDGASLSAVVSPRVGAVLPSSSGIWRASVGRGFRAPTLAERFVTTVVPPFTVIPNPDLTPETAWTAELGDAVPVSDRLRFDASVFWTSAAGLIEPDIDPSTIQIQFRNVDRARLAGLDLVLEASPFSPHLTTTLAYTYLDARALAHDTVPAHALAFRPRHLLTLGADFVWGAASIGADYRYASRFDRVELFPSDARISAKVLDLRAGWTQGPLSARILVANALNYIYNLVPRTLAPVRTATVTLTYLY